MTVKIKIDNEEYEVVDIFSDEGALVVNLSNNDKYYIFLTEDDMKKWLFGLMSIKASQDKEWFLEYVGSYDNHNALKASISLNKLIEIKVDEYYKLNHKQNSDKWSEVYYFRYLLPYPLIW